MSSNYTFHKDRNTYYITVTEVDLDQWNDRKSWAAYKILIKI